MPKSSLLEVTFKFTGSYLNKEIQKQPEAEHETGNMVALEAKDKV